MIRAWHSIGALCRRPGLPAAVLALALLPACGGSKVFVNFPEKAPSPGEKAAPAAPPGPPDSAAPSGEAPLPYWVLYRTWWGDHRDLLRRLESTSFSLPRLENLFLRSQESLHQIGDRLPEKDRPDLEAFVLRYDELRKEAVRDTNRGILRERLEGLGKEISHRFSEEPGAKR